MPIEIERKFLVIGESWRQKATRRVLMRQGYMTEDQGRSSIRVRLQGVEARLNIKASVIGRSRAEYDYPMPVKDAREILDTLCVGLIDKTRHYIEVPAGTEGNQFALIWEIDEFAGANAGLIVAELELRHMEQTFQLPDWLGREVTEERRYYNHALALHPYRDWRDQDRA